MKRILCALLTAAFLMGGFAACAPNAQNPDEVPGASSMPAEDFVLNVSIAPEPQTLDPALNASVDGSTLIQHFFEGLMKWSNDGAGNAVIVPGQAESYDKTENEDGTVTYTFTLREDARWSDGKNVTAGDFVYSWQRLVSSETAAAYTGIIDMVVGFDEIFYGTPTGETQLDADGQETEIIKYAAPETLAVSAPDDKTFAVTLYQDCPYFESVCAFPATFPVRQDIIESAGGQWTYSADTYIGNGPYKMTQWDHNSLISTVKNDQYYDYDALGPDELNFYLMDNAASMYTAFKNDDLQFAIDVPLDETQTLLADGSLKVKPVIGTYFLNMNNQAAPFDDARVRQAFSMAIDRNYLVETVTGTGETPAGAYIPDTVNDVNGDSFRTIGGEYYSVASENYEKNCEKARELLAEAGYPNGEGLPAVEYMYNTGDSNVALAEALQNMWKTVLGVNVTLNALEWSAYFETLFMDDFQLCCIDWFADYNDPGTMLDMWHSQNGNNVARYANPEYDAIIETAKVQSDIQKRMESYHEAERLLIEEDCAIAPLYHNTQKYLLADSVSGMYYTPLGYFFFGYCSRTK